MHLILARRDLTGFQHLHPELGADGTWSRRVQPRRRRLLPRCSPTSRTTASARTLAADLRVDGAADLRPLPAPQPAAVSDGGYDVRLDAGGARAGEEADLRFTITRDGAPVETEPYLGAGGHLVALREGDLAFLHVHPDRTTALALRGRRSRPPAATACSSSSSTTGRIHTVAFTQEVR